MCSFELMQKIGQNIWKGSQVMVVEAEGMQGGIAIPWHDREVDLTGWRAGRFFYQRISTFGAQR